MFPRSIWPIAVTLLAIAGLASAADSGIAAAESSAYSSGPVPAWVRSDAPVAASSDGVEFLALDRQIRLGAHGSDTYVTYAQSAGTESSLEEASTHSIEFDPHSEHITLHTLAVRRGTQVIDQLKIAHQSVLRREDRLEDGLLDGNLTLNVVLEDIRVGDIVSVAYTRHADDPLMGNRYYDTFTTQWGVPTRWSRLRLLQPSNRPVVVQQVGMDTPAVVTEAGGVKESVWEWRDLPAIRTESQRPSWHVHYPRFRLSEWRDWKEVVDWAISAVSTQHAVAGDEGSGPRLDERDRGDRRAHRARAAFRAGPGALHGPRDGTGRVPADGSSASPAAPLRRLQGQVPAARDDARRHGHRCAGGARQHQCVA